MHNSQEVANTIKALAKSQNMTIGKMLSACSLSINTLSSMQSGGYYPRLEAICKIADYLGCSVDYLLGRTDRNFSPASFPSSHRTVSVYGKIPAGLPMEAIEDIIDTEDIPEEWFRGGKDFFGLKITGDSMYPKYLTGDTVIFEKADTCESGQDCAVMIGTDDATFKRVLRSLSGITLQPLNPEYAPRTYSNDEIEALPVRIIGIARELRRKTN